MSSPYSGVGPTGDCVDPWSTPNDSGYWFKYWFERRENMLYSMQSCHNVIIKQYQKLIDYYTEKLAESEQAINDKLLKLVQPMIDKLTESESNVDKMYCKCSDKLIKAFTPILTRFLEMEEKYGTIIPHNMEEPTNAETEQEQPQTPNRTGTMQSPSKNGATQPTIPNPIQSQIPYTSNLPQTPSPETVEREKKCVPFDICFEGYLWGFAKAWWKYLWPYLYATWYAYMHQHEPVLLARFQQWQGQALNFDFLPPAPDKPDKPTDDLLKQLDGIFAAADGQPVMTEAEALAAYGAEESTESEET